MRALPYVVNQLYGFPPNVGAVGTAALLNVGSSLTNLLKELKGQGYSVGGSGFGLGPLDGGHPVLLFIVFLFTFFLTHCIFFYIRMISHPLLHPTLNSIFTPTLPLT